MGQQGPIWLRTPDATGRGGDKRSVRCAHPFKKNAVAHLDKDFIDLSLDIGMCARCREMPHIGPYCTVVIDRSLRKGSFFADKGSFFADKEFTFFACFYHLPTTSQQIVFLQCFPL